MRIVFMGTPEFAVPSLERLVDDGHEVTLVVTQPDRPAGRGRKVVAPAVKTAALRHSLPVIQPRRLREAAAGQAIVDSSPEAIVVAAFGQILPPNILGIPRLGCLNVHASLLPRWRGAAPISAAILAGDDFSGATVMLMDAGLDTGPILAAVSEPIFPPDTTESLGRRLAIAGAQLLSTTIPAWNAGALRPQPQDPAQATYASQLRKEDGLLDWVQPAEVLWRRVRAFKPWPAAFTYWQGRLLKVHECVPLPGIAGGAIGVVSLARTQDLRSATPYPDLLPASRQTLVVATGDGALALARVQLEGAKAMDGAAFVAGYGGVVGARLGR